MYWACRTQIRWIDLLHSGASIQNWENFIKNCGRYYKVEQTLLQYTVALRSYKVKKELLQIGPGNLRRSRPIIISVTTITK